jgi:hypothetical protein
VALAASRQRRRRRRRGRTGIILAALVVIAGVAAWALSSGTSPAGKPAAAPSQGAAAPSQGTAAASQASPDPTRGAAAVTVTSTRSGPGPSATASLARWRLPSPLTRADAAALPGGRILLLGGLLASDTSTAAVDVLDPATGTLRSVSTLPDATHDAATAVLGGRALLFGGGQSTSFSVVQAVPTRSSGTGGAVIVGQLPGARSDGEAAVVGNTAYVVGGYDGSSADPTVLATTDGAGFTSVVTLPVAVRYPAVAAVGGIVYAFGGEWQRGGTTSQYATPTGTTTPVVGQQVAVVQAINPKTRTARVVGYLPQALQGASAFVLGGHIFLAGGDSYPPGANPVSGSTIWSFDPATGAFHMAGHLAAPVAYAATVVVGKSAWLIGGERDGTPVTTAQRIVLTTSG